MRKKDFFEDSHPHSLVLIRLKCSTVFTATCDIWTAFNHSSYIENRVSPISYIVVHTRVLLIYGRLTAKILKFLIVRTIILTAISVILRKGLLEYVKNTLSFCLSLRM